MKSGFKSRRIRRLFRYLDRIMRLDLEKRTRLKNRNAVCSLTTEKVSSELPDVEDAILTGYYRVDLRDNFESFRVWSARPSRDDAL